MGNASCCGCGGEVDQKDEVKAKAGGKVVKNSNLKKPPPNQNVTFGETPSQKLKKIPDIMLTADLKKLIQEQNLTYV